MELIFVVFFIVLFALVFLTKKLNKAISYRKNGPLFTAAERSFLGILDAAVSDRYRILGKVRIADILSPQKGLDRKNWQNAFNKISAKHFDYVLCTKDTLDVIAVIELDDKSHNKKSVLARDAFVNRACGSAGLKLIRFPAKAEYSIDDIAETIKSNLDTNE